MLPLTTSDDDNDMINLDPCTTRFRQHHNYDCGVACVAFYAHLVADWTYSEEGYDALLGVMGTSPDAGTDTPGLVKGLESLGLEAWSSENELGTDKIWSYLGAAIWCIDNGEHWVVVLGSSGEGRVLYFDPETGQVHSCPHPEFQAKIATAAYTYVAAAPKNP